MSARTNNIRIGIFVLIAIALLIAGLMAFGAKSYFIKKVTFETAIEGEVSGLSVGSSVLFRGVPVAKVSNIDFAQNLHPSAKSDMIIVEFEAERLPYTRDWDPEARKRRVQGEISKGLRAMVKGQGITGTSLLALDHLNPEDYPPPPIDYEPRYLYIPSAPGQFTRMLESIERSLRNIQKLDIEGLGLAASNTLAKATLLLGKLHDLDLESFVGKAGTTLDQIKTTVGNLDTTIQGMKLATLSGDADQLVVELKESNTKLQTVLDHLGDLPLQDTMADVRSAVQKLDDVLLDLKRYPSGFIFGQPPLPAKSVQPPAR